MKNQDAITNDKVKYIAKLANLPVSDEETKKLSKDLSDTLEFINKVKQIDTRGLEVTSNVTSLENIFHDDKVLPSLTQNEALSGARAKYKGYFKVKAVLEE
ncbi:Asp-tRNA(Asn)/Glu-tRNA(Gln) amidotransferase subunit GatC [Candidatus Gottesmanbacteria bacterium]|nr:Asp-tRNA(Asn)/Glu-tRNA(Gln) amidotransferase subunit GatC [Candidatus Gottesmanbacteria bacterium]